MQITQIRIKLGAPAGDDRQLATAVLVFDEIFAVHDYRIIEGACGPYVQHPGNVFPINPSHRLAMDQAIIRAYESESARPYPAKQPHPMTRFLANWNREGERPPVPITQPVRRVVGFGMT